MCRSRSGESGDSNLITCNHDTLRTAQRLTERERKLAYATLLMLPGAPFIYYGDELGMRYRPLPSKEGGYTRTGSRTPMQWDDGANLGFSRAAAEALYLPVDPAEDAPTVERAMANKDSLWHTIRSVLTLRADEPALHAYSGFDVLHGEGRAFAFSRSRGDERIVIAVNPGRGTEQVPVEGLQGETLFAIGGPTFNADGGIMLPAQSFIMLK